jgi:hypothetical protein
MNPGLEALKALYNEEVGGIYYAGTLEINKFAYHPDCYEPIEGMFQREDRERQTYSDEERYWWSKLYLKHKTPNHAFWKQSEECVNEFGPKFGGN